jgi:putative endonuclease
LSLKHLKLGKTGEDLASGFLRSKGYKIISRNYRTKCGEIDIIGADNNILVFIEVKTRKSSFLESPFAAVTEHKQKQISKVAQEYLSKNNLFDKDARFDVISIVVNDSNIPQIEHLENAFDLSYGF